MRHRSAVLGPALTVALAAAAPASAAVEICATCDETLALDAQEWACLLADLDFYLSVPTEPVFVSLFGCDEAVEFADSLRGESVDLSMPGTEGAPYAPAMRLMHGQLQCLAERRAALEEAPPQEFDFRRDCALPAPPVE